jgi:cell wall-associated NlpC family hydrolase
MKYPIVCVPLFLLALSCGSMRQGTGGSATLDGSSLRTREVGVVEAPQGKAEEKKPAQSASEAKKPASEAAQKQAETLGDQVVAYARTFLGTPYKLGASGPKLFDCSGFTRYVYKHFGYEMTQYTGAQFKEGREVASFADLQKGDLVFFGQRGSVRNIGHVGIVVSIDEERGSFRFIHASSSGGVIESESTQSYYQMRYIGARRFLPDEPRKP